MRNRGIIARVLTIAIVVFAAIVPAQADIAPRPDLRPLADKIADHVTPTSFFGTLAILGAVAGWLTGRMMGSGGLGRISDVICGLIGAFIGGYSFALMVGGELNPLGLVVVLICGMLGAIILVAIFRLIKRAWRTSRPT